MLHHVSKEYIPKSGPTLGCVPMYIQLWIKNLGYAIPNWAPNWDTWPPVNEIAFSGVAPRIPKTHPTHLASNWDANWGAASEFVFQFGPDFGDTLSQNGPQIGIRSLPSMKLHFLALHHVSQKRTPLIWPRIGMQIGVRHPNSYFNLGQILGIRYPKMGPRLGYVVSRQ